MKSAILVPRLGFMLFCCCGQFVLHEGMQAAEQPKGLTGTNIEVRTPEEWRALPEQYQGFFRMIWETPLYLLNWEAKSGPAVPDKVLSQARVMDERYFQHLGLNAHAEGTPFATNADDKAEAVKSAFTVGKMKVETRQSVFVWTLWIPFSEHFKSDDAPASVMRLIPMIKGKVTRFTSEDGTDFYTCETEADVDALKLRQMMANQSGVLLWALKGDPLNGPFVISSQMMFNTRWFKAAQSGRR